MIDLDLAVNQIFKFANSFVVESHSFYSKKLLRNKFVGHWFKNIVIQKWSLL